MISWVALESLIAVRNNSAFARPLELAFVGSGIGPGARSVAAVAPTTVAHHWWAVSAQSTSGGGELPGGQLLIMVKPQFEAAREDVEPGGVVRDDTVRWQTVAQVETLAEALGCRVLGRAESQLHGPMGNREIFVLLQRTESAAPLDADPRA